MTIAQNRTVIPAQRLPEPASAGPLQDTLGLAPSRAAASACGEGGTLHHAVQWSSAHLTAVEQVIHPAARSVLPDAAQRLREQRDADRDLKQLLRLLERALSGDMQIAVPTDPLRRDLVEQLRALAAREAVLVGRLETVLSSDDSQALLAGYRTALTYGTTRPHPHLPRSGLLGRFGYRFCRLWDQALDTMDNRAVPWSRPGPEPKPIGRWGLWLLGTPDPGAFGTPGPGALGTPGSGALGTASAEHAAGAAVGPR